jgi:ATP-dependent Clp protease adaptor protein ClpS
MSVTTLPPPGVDIDVDEELQEEYHAEQRTTTRRKVQPPYHVILLNDDDHSYAYVVLMLKELFSHPVERGYKMAEEVDTKGRVIVLTTTMEHAELKRDQIHAYGPDASIPRCKGSMSAKIEPAE